MATQSIDENNSNNNLELIARLNNRINDTLRALTENNQEIPNLTPESNINIENIVSTQSNSDIEDENKRVEINKNYTDDEFFYADNEELFKSELEKAKTEDLEYEYTNVLNGSNNTFGLEIEFEEGNANKIAKELYDLGICGYDHQVNYHAPSISGKWKLEKDISVSGGELVSPPLKDTPETWKTLEKVCAVAKKYGAKSNRDSCGGHVHIGIEPLDTSSERWKRFLKSSGGFEDVMFRVSGGDNGVVRSDVSLYARRFAPNAKRGLNRDLPMINFLDVRSYTRSVSGRDRYQAINLTNIYRGKQNTIEFRSFNSSLDPRILQNNVKISNGILFASEKAKTSNDSESNSMKRRGSILENQIIGSENRNNDKSVRDFVDVIFTRKKDKDSALKLYAKNTWYNG
ncbi:MAG: amidoligase family protein [Clostridiales bacterium]